MMKYAIDSGPHIKSDDNIDSIYKKLFIALIPIVLFSIYKNVFVVYIEHKFPLMEVLHPLFIILVSVLVAITTERIYAKIDNYRNGYKKTNPFYPIITGIYISMILPPMVPLYVAAIASFIGIFLGKMLYGGFGKNLFNPTAIGYLFILILFTSMLSNYDNYFNLLEKTKYLTHPLNHITSFNYQKLVSPYGSLYNFLFGMVPGLMGTTNAFLILISFVFLSIFKVLKWKVTLSYILTVFVMTFIIGLGHGVGIWFPMFNILSGSLLFVAVFMNDPVTTASTNMGQILNGVLLGIITVVIRFSSPNPERIFIAVIISNLMIPYLDRFEVLVKKKSKYKYILIVLSIILIISLSFAISKMI